MNGGALVPVLDRISIARRPQEVDARLGPAVRVRRIELGMPMRELAHKLRMSMQQVGGYETGRHQLSAGQLWSASCALALSVDELVGRALADPPASPRLSARWRRLAANFVAIDDVNIQRCICVLAQVLAEPDDAASTVVGSNQRESPSLVAAVPGGRTA